jgi:HEAT repeat protein
MNRQGVEGLFDFLIKKQALGDKHGEVRRSMLEAGVEAVEVHGATHVSEMMSRFETHLASSSKSSDEINEAIVVLYGRLARHLKPDDTRLPKIVDQLVMALKTPSEQVQVAVAECLSPLAPMLPEIDKLVEGLFKEMLEGAKYGHRRGAAYGLSGVIHGLGISSIKAYEVMDRLRQALGEKKKYEPRQGAMFALETLATTLTRLFEPYITQVIPLLLQAYGDGTGDVREATEDASKAIMGSLSSYGVKLVLPSLLDALEEKQWRTKKGAIELLGAMAYCSPRQLSISLPTIIPRLTSVLTDSHAQVRAAANKSLKQFGEVISNPEIQRMVPVLLKGLVDPDKIPNGLSVLLKTSFMHYIDSPSLALVRAIVLLRLTR